MTNLRLTKGTVRPGRLLWLVAAGVAVAAGILPAQGAAARNRHNVESAHAGLAHHILRVRGTEGNDVIALRLASGNSAVVQVDLGDDGSADFSFSRAAIEGISVRGRGGDDRIRIDDTNGAFTTDISTRIDGGRGSDKIAGGAGAETLLGGPGNDSIDGNGGSDVSNLGPGDDSFVWDPGDGSDTIEGNDGTDALVFNGAAASETVNLAANGNRLRFFRNPGNITMDTHGVEQADFNALGGADAITVNDLTGTDVRNVNLDLAGSLGGATGDGQTDTVLVAGTVGSDSLAAAGDASGVTVSGLQAQVTIRHQEPTDQLLVSGGAGDDAISATGLAAGAITEFLLGLDGNDTILGGPGAETLLGGSGNDTIDGNGGNDSAGLGAGSDTFVWDPGDGSDTIEGDDGTDTMVFNGAAASENVALSANGDRLRFFRNPGNITMDTHGVERVDFKALGGADFIDVGNLGATDVTSLNLDLAGTLGGSTGDNAVDSVLVAGSPGDDAASISGDASGVKVSGLHTSVAIQHHELGDSLSVAGLDGADTIDASNLAAATIGLVLAGNAGNDTLDGGKGVEILKGGDGNDVVDGNGGNDLADLGAGSDTFVWDPGDGSDTIEGGEDSDTMVFNGAAAAETVNLSAIGDHLRFFRNPGGITMDTHGVERVAFNALGGADTVAVHNLSATDVSQVGLDLAGTLGGATGDGQADRVVLDGTNGDDAITVAGDANDVHVTGLAPTVDLLHTEAADQLDLETFSGINTVASGGLAAGTIQLSLDGVLIP